MTAVLVDTVIFIASFALAAVFAFGALGTGISTLFLPAPVLRAGWLLGVLLPLMTIESSENDASVFEVFKEQ